MKQRVLYVLLAVVAAAAAVLSFSALRDLAETCGFDPRLAWLLPVTVDAGAAAGSLIWLGNTAPAARTYGRALALTLLGSSVGGNALGHGLQAYGARPHWGVVVAVSAIAPAVLGALVHLVVLASRPQPTAKPTAPTEAYVWNGAEVVSLAEWENELGPGQGTPPPAPDLPDREPTTADRPTVAPPMTDDEIVAEAREWAVDLGRPASRDEMLARYRIGAPRARKLRERLGWADAPTGGADR